MSALSLQLRPNNETLFFIRSECSTTQLGHIILTCDISKRHNFGRLSRPVKFSVLNSVRLLRCYTVIKR